MNDKDNALEYEYEDNNDNFLNEENDNNVEVDNDQQDDNTISTVVPSSKLLELNAVLRIYCSNFRNLHWNCVGEEFNDAHVNIAQGYVDLCDKYIDTTGEMITRLDMNPLNYIEVVEYLNKAENNYMSVNSSKLYTRKEVIENSQKMLEDIVRLITDVLGESIMNDVINAGIKSDLESMLNEFDIQYRYINKRRTLAI